MWKAGYTKGEEVITEFSQHTDTTSPAEIEPFKIRSTIRNLHTCLAYLTIGDSPLFAGDIMSWRDFAGRDYLFCLAIYCWRYFFRIYLLNTTVSLRVGLGRIFELFELFE